MTKTAVNIIKGRVIRGEGRGRQQGYPTANLDRRYFRTHPIANGVYAGLVEMRKKQRRCLVIVGAPYAAGRKKIKKIEVHILNFRGNIRRVRLEVRLIKKIRPMKTFTDQKSLLRQIRSDIRRAKNIFHYYSKKHV
ncbi:MAG: riboflavin kinase [Patescibacteria group bacterium]